MPFEKTPGTEVMESVLTWPMRSMRSHVDRPRRMLMLRFDHEISATKEARGGRRITSSEPSGRRWRVRNEAKAEREEHIKNVMAKNTTVAENGIQGSFAPITEHSPAAWPANSIHLSLQGKGGVGKSLIASILAQYFTDRCREIQCID